MLSFIIIIFLAYAYYVGTRRGLAMQGVYTIGCLIAFIIARLGYLAMAPKLTLLIPYQSATETSQFAFFSHKTGLELDNAFYAAIGFLLILFIGWLATRFIAVLLQQLTFYPLEPRLNVVGGGVLSAVTVYIGVFLFLTVLALIPSASIQSLLSHSLLAQGMVRFTPIPAIHWWLQAI
ncbi:CvpA family protein [Loigolactobacillus zhaoyuanensis]|uniref:CvpA family protein n=1 Tax=Loigolactobacillus zhaoyuanensis TaxID=2486017 RepID=A0ABW8UB01_9LACO|nr:CvpA family protein [Loigolactobacillus zhaoyuanensis]